MAIASRLDEAEFQVCLKISEADRERPEPVAEQLKKNFIKGKTDEEVSVVNMNDRTMKERETLAQFAHEIGRLVKLACSGFEESSLSTVTRDAFIRGLPEELRL